MVYLQFCTSLGSLWPVLKQHVTFSCFIFPRYLDRIEPFCGLYWGPRVKADTYDRALDCLAEKNSPLALASSPLDFGFKGSRVFCGVRCIWISLGSPWLGLNQRVLRLRASPTRSLKIVPQQCKYNELPFHLRFGSLNSNYFSSSSLSNWIRTLFSRNNLAN
jgi:hypothetical protein